MSAMGHNRTAEPKQNDLANQSPYQPQLRHFSVSETRPAFRRSDAASVPLPNLVLWHSLNLTVLAGIQRQVSS
jgi:hypothetical protein